MTFSALRLLPRPAWALFIGTFINRFGSFVVPFLTLYLTRRGYSAAQAGMVLGVYGLGSLAAAGLGGYLADRFGRRACIALSMFSSAAVMLVILSANSLLLLALLTGLAGLATELYRPAAGALIADLFPPRQRLTSFALYRLVVNLGVAIGVATGGFLADRSFDLLFLGDAATSLAYGVVALVALPAGVPSRPAAATAGDTVGDAGDTRSAKGLFSALHADRPFLIFLIASLMGTFIYLQSFSTLSLQVSALGLPSAVYGGLLTLNGLLVFFLELPLTTVVRRFPPTVVIAAGQLLIGVGFGLVILAHTPLFLAVTVLFWTFGEILKSAMSVTYVADRAPMHLRGQYQGVWGLHKGLGLIIAPVVGTRLFSWSSPGLWLICGVLGALAAGLILFSDRTQ
ncbi:MAG TPA: MFS transporter [Ktedonobacterales bacterium]|nr:MFS transporter [Ktedonobacterales bacterium]